jgi:TetR/AcrR family transcriptional regulator
MNNPKQDKQPANGSADVAAKPRSRGRPAEEQSGEIRQSILNEAEKLFAQQGFAATPVREIAKAAGITPAMIHYYFGSKKTLLRSVLDRTLQPMILAIANLQSGSGNPVKVFVSLLVKMAHRHPNMPVLLTREVLMPGGQLQEHFVEQFAPRLGGALSIILTDEQSRGKINSEIDPRLGTLMVLSLCLFPFLAKSVAQNALGIRYDAAGIEQLEQQVQSLLQQGLVI